VHTGSWEDGKAEGNNMLAAAFAETGKATEAREGVR
jgi:hypothetical protein